MKLNTKALAQVELGIPVIVEGVYHARIEEPRRDDKGNTWIKPNKQGTGNNLVVMYRILDPLLVSHKDGKEIENKGQICLSRYYSLVPNETSGYDPDKSMKELAVAIKNPPENDLNVEDLGNKIVMVKIGVKEEEKDEKTGKTYPMGNEVNRATPVPDDDTFTVGPF